jgi:hypothetical protein
MKMLFIYFQLRRHVIQSSLGVITHYVYTKSLCVTLIMIVGTPRTKEISVVSNLHIRQYQQTVDKCVRTLGV